MLDGEPVEVVVPDAVAGEAAETEFDAGAGATGGVDAVGPAVVAGAAVAVMVAADDSAFSFSLPSAVEGEDSDCALPAAGSRTTGGSRLSLMIPKAMSPAMANATHPHETPLDFCCGISCGTSDGAASDGGSLSCGDWAVCVDCGLGASLSACKPAMVTFSAFVSTGIASEVLLSGCLESPSSEEVTVGIGSGSGSGSDTPR